MKILLDNKVVNDKIVSYEQAQQAFEIDLQKPYPEYYTVIVRDVSLIPTYVHLLEVNIPVETSTGDVLFPYISPQPPSSIHDYLVEIYYQAEYISLFGHVNRRMSLERFIRVNNLQLLDSGSFQVSSK